MATPQGTLTPTTATTPATADVSTLEPSGAQWVSRYPTSKAINDLISPFREAVSSFVSTMQAAGASVSISATRRPAERAYLMHWSWEIVNSGQDPRTVPAMSGVSIRWDHEDSDGTYNAQQSIAAAQAMVDGYGIQDLDVAPALNSKHIQGLAIDMSISWSGDLTINNANGNAVTITSTPRTGMNGALATVGASYGVIKFVGGAADKPHWSDNGH